MSTAAFPLSKSNQRAYLKHEAHEELMSDFCCLKRNSCFFVLLLLKVFALAGSSEPWRKLLAVISARSPHWGDELAGD
jgi:hypothetical protein